MLGWARGCLLAPLLLPVLLLLWQMSGKRRGLLGLL